MVMQDSLIQSGLEALKAQVCIIDADGKILFVNESWRIFGAENGMLNGYQWEGLNYFSACGCNLPAQPEVTYTLSRIKEVALGYYQHFETEYPCDSPNQRRWFLMMAAHFEHKSQSCCIISHVDISRRKLMGEQAEHLALTDPLTGLANRRAMEDFLNQQCQLAMRTENPLSVLMIDIDHFKQINDQYGHLFGDRCLNQIGRLITPSVRKSSDLIARYGGEEFVVILPGADLDEALKKAGKIVDLMRNFLFTHDETLIHVTVSVGIYSGIPSKQLRSEDFIDHADSALLNAKKAGRNCVMVFEATEPALI